MDTEKCLGVGCQVAQSAQGGNRRRNIQHGVHRFCRIFRQISRAFPGEHGAAGRQSATAAGPAGRIRILLELF